MTQAPQAREAVPPARGKAPASPAPGPAATPPDVPSPLGRSRGVAAPGSPPPVKQPRRAAGDHHRQRPVPEASTGRAGTRTFHPAAKARAAERAAPPAPFIRGSGGVQATAHCIGRCDWAEGPGEPASIGKAAEKHVRTGHPAAVVVEAARREPPGDGGAGA